MIEVAKLLLGSLSVMEAAVTKNDRGAVDAEVENLISMAVPLVATSDTEALGETLPALERLYSTTLASAGAEDRDDAIVGQLAVLVTFFAVAAARPGRSSLEKLAEEPAAAAILRVAAAASHPLDNQELAEAANYTPATVARTLPKLRNAGLFEVERDWRRKLNRITDAGRELARRLPVVDQPSPGKARPYFDLETMLAETFAAEPRALDLEKVAGELRARLVDSSPQAKPSLVPRRGYRRAFSLYALGKSVHHKQKQYAIANEVARELLQADVSGTALRRKKMDDLLNNRAVGNQESAMAAAMVTAITMPEIPVIKAAMEGANLNALASTFNVSRKTMEGRIAELNLQEHVR